MFPGCGFHTRLLLLSWHSQEEKKYPNYSPPKKTRHCLIHTVLDFIESSRSAWDSNPQPCARRYSYRRRTRYHCANRPVAMKHTCGWRATYTYQFKIYPYSLLQASCLMLWNAPWLWMVALLATVKFLQTKWMTMVGIFLAENSKQGRNESVWILYDILIPLNARL